MNYLAEMNAFYDWLDANALPTSSIAMWHALMSIANKANWPKSITVAVSTLKSKTGLGKDGIYNARKTLQEKGRIQFKPRDGNQSAVYMIIPFASAQTTQDGCVGSNDTMPDTIPDTEPTQPPTQYPTQPATIIKTKLDETKQEEIIILQKNPPIPYEKIRDEYNRVCVNFPKCTKLSNKRKEAIGARIHSGYSFDDFARLFQMAQESDYLKGKNKYNWRADFDWLICDANMAKTLDGKYENRNGTETESQPQNGDRREDGRVYLDGKWVQV